MSLSMDAESAREAMMLSQFADKDSALYKGMVAVLLSCEAADRRAKMTSKAVTVPFNLVNADLIALESQFGVRIKMRGVHNRAALPPRPSAVVHMVDSMLADMSMGGGRTSLCVDFDLASFVAVGMEGRCVERTHASARLEYGYFAEDDALRKMSTSKEGGCVVSATLILSEVAAGVGEHFSSQVRLDGPRVDVVVVDHFRTPVGPGQVAWLAHKRGAYALGAFPFQVDMLYADEGELSCFPGRFYVDRVNDTITLVPATDATMSISHPYSSLMDFIRQNSVRVGGVEFLCEKFLTVKGIMFYTLREVGSDVAVPEAIRTSLYDAAAARTLTITFPKAKLSDAGVLVSWESCSVRMLASRFEAVMARCRCSANTIVTPREVFSALVDNNNVVVNTLDTAVRAERMSYRDEVDLSVALALHINYVRHQSKGTLNKLLGALKLRHSLNDRSVLAFAAVALSAWWSQPSVFSSVAQGDLPYQQVVDWCGNDFSVCVSDTQAWVDVETETLVGPDYVGRQYAHFPRHPGVSDAWYTELMRFVRSSNAVSQRRRVSAPSCPVQLKVRSATLEPVISTVCVDEYTVAVKDPVKVLTDVKARLVKKLASEQGAVDLGSPIRNMLVRARMTSESTPDIPVADVEPISAVAADMDRLLGGPVERDAVATGYRIAEVDIDARFEGSVTVNDNRRDIPMRKLVRRPRVDAGVEGARPVSFASLFGAVKKRNVGIPPNRGNVDLDSFPGVVVQRFIDVCFRDDWRDILAKHIASGLWEFNTADIEQYMDSIDERKARSLLDPVFREGDVDLSRWLLMAKGKVKPSKEVDACFKVDHAQTILYLENGAVNAAYSAMTKRFKKCLDEMLRPNIQINSQMNLPEHEEWYNSLESDRVSRVSTMSYSVDARSYDRSQDHVGLRCEMQFYRLMGLSEDRIRIWSETHGVKKATSLMFRLVLHMVLGGLSGDWKTLLRNGLIMGFAVVSSTAVTRRSLVCLDVKGDDVDMEVDGTLAVDAAVDRMCLGFNLSAKFFTSDVRYFCKMFRIKKWGRWYFLADPWARIQSVCTPVVVGNEVDTLSARWDSLKPDLFHYDNGELVDEVARAAQQYYHLDIAPYGIARSLAKFACDKSAYFGFFCAPEYVS